MKNVMRLAIIAGAVAASMACAAQAADYVPTADVDYLPPTGLRQSFYLPQAARLRTAGLVEEALTIQTRQPVRLVTAWGYHEKDGSYTYCGVYGSAGHANSFILNFGTDDRRQSFHIEPPKDLLVAFGCADNASVTVR